MRTVSANLNAASVAEDRYPVARAVIRDVRLRFAAPDSVWTSAALTNPWNIDEAAGQNDQPHDQKAVFGDQLTLSNGKIVRAYPPVGGSLQTNWIDDPSVSANWSNWTTTGITAPGDVLLTPGLVEAGGYVYLIFDQFGGYKVYRCPITATQATHSWTLHDTTNISHLGATTVAPISETEFFAAVAAPNHVAFYRVAKSGGVWSASEMPGRLTGTSEHRIASSTEYSSSTYFDAFTLNGRTFLVYSIGYLGQVWLVEYKAGTFSNPRLLLPDDYTKVRLYRISVIGSRAWATIRLERDNEPGYSPAWDAYLYSDDGENWTALARDSWLTEDELRGKLHLSGGWVYYAGMGQVIRAPATSLIDTSDPAAKRLVIGKNKANWLDAASWGGATVYDDLKGGTASFPSQGTAPQLSLTLANGDDDYNYSPKADVLREGADMRLEAGYVIDGAGTEEYVPILAGNVDQVQRAEAPGSRTLAVVARDAQFKKLRDWNSPFYWPLVSQLKHHDDCRTMGSLEVKRGDWDARSRNLLSNGDFEGEVQGEWTPYWTGASDKAVQRERTKEDKWEGEWSYKVQKYGGTGDKVGIAHTTFQAVAGHEYTVECHTRVKHILGGEQEVVLEAAGNWGAGGSAQTATHAEHGATDDAWVMLTVTFTATTTAAVTVRFYLGNCTDALALVDSFNAYDTDLAVCFSDVDTDGIAFATSPLDTVDFDIRARMMDEASAPARVMGMGLVGCAANRDNLLLFELERTAGSTKAGLWKKRGGVYTLLQQVSFTWSANTLYDLRFVQRGGHIWCYAKAAASSDWGAPLFTSGGYDHYVWGEAEPICPSEDGRGKVGLRGYIAPTRFLAYGVDAYSSVLCVHRQNVDDWTLFANDATPRRIKIGDEVMLYTGRSPNGTAHPANGVGFGWAAGAGQRLAYNPSDAFPRMLAIPQDSDDNGGDSYAAWDHYLDLGPNPLPGAADNAYNDYGVVFPACAEPYAHWQIVDSFNPGHASKAYNNWGDWQWYETGGVSGVNYNPNCARLLTAPSGHADTNGQANPAPNWHIFGGPAVITADLCPALFNVERGRDNTTATAHPDKQYCREYWDDELQVRDFVANDFEPDWSTETLLRRICAMTGVLAVEFANYHASGPYTLNNWDGVWLNGVDRRNFELRFNFPTPGSNWQGAGVRYRTSDGVDGQQVQVYRLSGVFYGYFMVRDAAGQPVYEETVRLMQPLVSGATNQFRLVVNQGWHTLYVNGAHVMAFYSDEYLDKTVNKILPIGQGGLTFTDFEIDELDEWREAIRVDNNQGGMQALQRVLEDRPIKLVSRSGLALKFSTFDNRPQVFTNNANTSGSFGPELFGDQEGADDGDRFSMARLEAEGILEVLDADLLRDHGYLFTMLHMPRASNEIAAAMLARTFREVKEGMVVTSQPVRANFRFEPEDRYQVSYPTLDTGRAVTRDLIVNNVDFELAPASFKMTVGARRFQG